MKNSPESSRRGFIKKLATSTAAVAVGTNVLAASAAENNTAHFQIHKRQFSAINDNINIALIGAGGMGTQDTLTALKVPGVKLVAVCDLYTGRLNDAKKRWGQDIYTTRMYKEILNRPDVDCLLYTSDAADE